MTVEKLTSLNPTQYTEMPLDEAVIRYLEYYEDCQVTWPRLSEFGKNFKPFEKWLETEI